MDMGNNSNLREIDWELTLNTNQAMTLVASIIDNGPHRFDCDKKYRGELTENTFSLLIKRSILWGTAFRKEIEGEGSVIDSEDGCRLSATFRICSPYKYVKLKPKFAVALVIIFILSWIGLVIDSLVNPWAYLSLLAVPAFFISCFLLLIGAWRFIFIEDKLNEVMKIFKATFSGSLKK